MPRPKYLGRVPPPPPQNPPPKAVGNFARGRNRAIPIGFSNLRLRFCECCDRMNAFQDFQERCECCSVIAMELSNLDGV